MAYRTILVHLNDPRRIGRVAAAAAELAQRFQAHLAGLSVTPPVHAVPTGVPGSPDTLIIDERAQAYRDDNPDMRAAFEAATAGCGITSEWRQEDAAGATVADVVIRHGAGADLVIAAQSDPHWPGSAWLDVADHLAVETGRPLLIIPNEGHHAGIGTRVLIAWNGRREATRAVSDALPLLQCARSVTLLALDPEPEEQPSRRSLAVAALARHGVPCETVEQASDGGNIGRTLLSHASAHRADLLVMGCYGHSRLREFVRGGATRHVLAHTAIPVLMSH